MDNEKSLVLKGQLYCYVIKSRCQKVFQRLEKYIYIRKTVYKGKSSELCSATPQHCAMCAIRALAATRSWAKPHQSDHSTARNHFSTVGDFSWCLWSGAGNSKNRCWEKLASKCAMWGTANPWGCKEVWCNPNCSAQESQGSGAEEHCQLTALSNELTA